MDRTTIEADRKSRDACFERFAEDDNLRNMAGVTEWIFEAMRIVWNQAWKARGLEPLSWKDVADGLPKQDGWYWVYTKDNLRTERCFNPQIKYDVVRWEREIAAYIPYPIPPYDKEQR